MSEERRIKELEEQLATVEKALQKQRDRNRTLESENRQLKITLRAVGKGLIEGLKSVMDDYERLISQLTNDRDEAFRIIDPILHILDPNGTHENSPIRQLKHDNGRWKRTMLGVMLIGRDSDNQDYTSFYAHGIYNGEREVAVTEVGMRIAEALFPIPASDDIPKTPTGFAALTNEDIGYIFTELSLVLTEDEYQQQRLKLFQEFVWPKLNQPDFLYDRDSARIKYNHFVDTAFDNFHKRQGQYRRVGFKLHGQHLLEEGSQGNGE